MKEDQEKARTDKWGVAAVVSGAAAFAGMAVAVCLLAGFYGEEKESESKAANLRESARKPTVMEGSERKPAVMEDTGEQTESDLCADSGSIPEKPYAELFEQNQDMAAWLVVEGTVMDYPVMQTEDEEYYLYRDFYGNDDKAGCLILDTDSLLYDESISTNLIIHGHNMRTGTMFGALDEYREEEYYQEHRYMELYTETERRDYEVIAVFYSQVYYPTDLVFKYYHFFKADNEKEFDYFYDNIKELSLYDTGVTAELGDHFLTLSTCAYHVEEGRFVVVAKEIGRNAFLECDDLTDAYQEQDCS